jgi:hypothetical protein
VNLIRDSSAPSDHLFKHLGNIVCTRALACLIFMRLMITLTASAGYLTRSSTNILAATGWRWIGTATTAFLHSSPSCGGIASSAPDSPTTSPGIRRWPKPSCTHSALITRATTTRNGSAPCAPCRSVHSDATREDDAAVGTSIPRSTRTRYDHNGRVRRAEFGGAGRPGRY